MRKILIIGKESYIGESLKRWLDARNYITDICSPLNKAWQNVDFTQYNVVINFAGIAHINSITKSMEPLFYSINRDLTIELGKHAKECGVKHFIHFSSMNVYGDFCGTVSDRNATNPTSFYGDSKLQGELGLQKLAEESFVIAYIRPPFVYGKGCKGNYNTIRKIANSVPVFPKYKNKKSMIYIDNLCEFVRLLIDSGQGGVFTPQNRELVSTSELVQTIAQENEHYIWLTVFFNWAIPIGMKFTPILRRAFMNDCYKLELSNHFNYDYCLVSFDESIRETEK